jgi:hypothetical protein
MGLWSMETEPKPKEIKNRARLQDPGREKESEMKGFSRFPSSSSFFSMESASPSRAGAFSTGSSSSRRTSPRTPGGCAAPSRAARSGDCDNRSILQPARIAGRRFTTAKAVGDGLRALAHLAPVDGRDQHESVGLHASLSSASRPFSTPRKSSPKRLRIFCSSFSIPSMFLLCL